MATELPPDKQILKEIQDYIAGLTPEKQGIVAEKAAQIRLIASSHPDGLGHLAVALVGAESAAAD